MILEMRNICKDYPMGKTVTRVLRDVSLNVSEGEYLAIMGPSGSGKTTLMNIIGCLDEPTSGLDPLMQQKFFNLIKEENKRGATVFFSSHILGEVQKMCNRVAIIKDGSIVNIQDIKTLQKDNYKKIEVSAADLDDKRFAVAGVSNLTKDNGGLKFFYKGDINQIMRIILEKEVSDVTIEEPTLEEIFMHYYE